MTPELTKTDHLRLPPPKARNPLPRTALRDGVTGRKDACAPLLLSSTKIGRLLRLHTLLREERTLGAHSLHTVSYSLGGMSPTGTAIAAHSGAQEQPRDSHALCSLSGGMNSTPDFSARC